jgi:osmotically inducible lipoprotein OsmB
MDMNIGRTRLILAVGATAAMALAGCAGMSSSERSTATGAAVGGAAGAVLTNSAAGAAVGAVVGGVVGHEVEKKKDK